MARAVPKQSLTRSRNPDNCWWTETGWHCCTSGQTPWPSCVAGGVTLQQRGYGPPLPPNGSYAAAAAAGVIPDSGVMAENRRAPVRRLSNPLPTDVVLVVASPNAVPAGADEYLVAPNGAYPGASAWLYHVGASQPTMVTINEIFNDQSGVFASVTASVASVFGPSQTGGFGEVLAPFSQGGSVRTTSGSPVRSANPGYYDVQGSLARAGRATRSTQVGSFSPFEAPSVEQPWIYAARRSPPNPQTEQQQALALGVSQYFTLAHGILGPTGIPQDIIWGWLNATDNSTPPKKVRVVDQTVIGMSHYVKLVDMPSIGGGFAVSNPPRQSLTRRRNPRRGEAFRVQVAKPATSNLACMVDVSALRLHCPGSPLHGIEVTDIEGDGGVEGELVAVSYIDPTTGTETVAEFPVAPDQGVGWWEHDGHCCESCALGQGCESEAA